MVEAAAFQITEMADVVYRRVPPHYLERLLSLSRERRVFLEERIEGDLTPVVPLAPDAEVPRESLAQLVASLGVRRNRQPDGRRRMRVGRAPNLLAVLVSEQSRHQRQVARSADQIDHRLAQIEAGLARGFFHDALHRLECAFDQGAAFLVKIADGDGDLTCAFNPQPEINRDAARIRMEALLFVAALFEQLEERGVRDLVYISLLERQVEQDDVEVVAAEFGDAFAAQDFVVALDEVDHRRIERAAAEIVNDQSLALRRAAARQVMGVLYARR